MNNRSQIDIWGTNLSYDDHHLKQPSLVGSSGRKMSFISQKSQPTHQNQIQEKHAELNQYIDVLDSKIHKIVQHNEAEILFAYRNHLTRVKKQMEQINEKAMANANSSSSQLEKIEKLEKQLSIFRQQSLKLFQKVVQKDKIIEELTFRIDQLKSEKKYMDQTVKILTKRNKYLENKQEDNAQIIYKKQNQEEKAINIDLNYLTAVPFKHYFYKTNQKKNRPMTTNLIQKNKSNSNYIKTKINTVSVQKDEFPNQIQQLCNKIRENLKQFDENILNELIQTIKLYSNEISEKVFSKKVFFANKNNEKSYPLENKRTRFSMRSKSNYTNDFVNEKFTTTNYVRAESLKKVSSIRKQSQSFAIEQELLEYFRLSVETVKKQITRRKSNSSINFYKEGSPLSISQFKKIDFFRLLELVFSNEKIIQSLYVTIFGKSTE